MDIERKEASSQAFENPTILDLDLDFEILKKIADIFIIDKIT